jgi:hypothetical protein
VSPSLSDSLRLGLSPDRVVFARFGRGLRPKLVERGVVPVEAAAGDDAWRGPLAALPELLKVHAPRAARASLVLSSHFVHHLVLKANESLSSREEWREYAAHRFEKIYGARALGWDIQVASADKAQPRLASAIDRTLIEAAVAAFKDSRARLESIQPHVVSAFNRALPSAPGASFWFALREPGRLLLGFIGDGAWRSVRCRRATERWRDELPQWLERESALLATGEPCRELVVSDEQPYAMVSA